MLTEEKIKIIEENVTELINQAKIPGLSLGIIINNELSYTFSFGERDIETKLPVNTDTLFGGQCTLKNCPVTDKSVQPV